MPSGRSPFAQSLSGILEHVLKPLADKNSSLINRIAKDWHLIAGEKTASLTRPHKIIPASKGNKDTILCLDVEEGYILDIQHQGPLIIEKIASYFGFQAVTKLRYKQVTELNKKKILEVSAKTLSEEEKQEIDSEVEGIEDKELAAALKGLGEELVKSRHIKK